MKRQHWLSTSLLMIALIGLIVVVQPVAPAGAGDGGGSIQGGGGSSALSIAGDTFVPESDSTVFRTNANGAVMVNSTTDAYMHAPVNLPDGAQIATLVFYYYDNNDPGYMVAYLIRNNAFGFGSRAYLASPSSPSGIVAGSHYGNSSYTLPMPEVVDNASYNYEIEVHWTAASTEANGLRLMGVKVVYSE
jgi:hypothetical protein